LYRALAILVPILALGYNVQIAVQQHRAGVAASIPGKGNVAQRPAEGGGWPQAVDLPGSPASAGATLV